MLEKGKPSVMYYNPKDEDKTRKVQACCAMAGVKIRPVPQDHGLPEDGEMMMFYHMSDVQLKRFLDIMKKVGVRVALKCVETEHNKDWPLSDLYQELQKEHAYMNGRKEE